MPFQPPPLDSIQEDKTQETDFKPPPLDSIASETKPSWLDYFHIPSEVDGALNDQGQFTVSPIEAAKEAPSVLTEGAMTPLLSAEDLISPRYRLGLTGLKALESMPGMIGSAAKIAGGVEESARKNLAGITSPAMIGLAAVGGELPGLATKGLGGLFGLQAVKALPQTLTEIGQSIEQGNLKKGAENVSDLFLEGLMAGGGAKAILDKTPIIPEANPETLLVPLEKPLEQPAQETAASLPEEPKSAPESIIEQKKAAPVRFVGMQEVPGKESFPLFNLTENVAGHPEGSTVSGRTLQELGYEVPDVNKAFVHFQSEPIPAAERPLGIVAPGTVSFWDALTHLISEKMPTTEGLLGRKRGLEMQVLPKITIADRATGEIGARYGASYGVGRLKGLEFADQVLQGLDDRKFGTALSEDNLRSIKTGWMDLAKESLDKAAIESNPQLADTLRQDAEEYRTAAESVRSLVGAKNSPFKTEAEYQAFLNDPLTQAAIKRHKQLWEEQKDPLFRQANDLDPETELASRGLQTGARINLKAVHEGDVVENKITGTGTGGGRQLASILSKDRFSKRATGLSNSYEGSYREIIAHGFEKELPVALQHEFIKKLIESGNAVVTDSMKGGDLTVKGEKTKPYLLKMRPWNNKFLQLRNSLTHEYESLVGIESNRRIPILSAVSDFLTRQSVAGLAEGTTHSANLLSEIFTGLGPTPNPIVNALLKTFGRMDLIYRLPKVFITAIKSKPKDLLALAEIGATKEGYKGLIAGRLLNSLDRSVRLNAAEVYKNMAKEGWVQDTETGLREFVNQTGNYNKRFQPYLIRFLRNSGAQPFATAYHNFNAMAVRRLGLGPGAKAPTKLRALALRADILGGWVGFAAIVTGLNYLISGNAFGPTGTPLGAVGWIGDDGKTKFFDVGGMTGYGRSLRISGIKDVAEGQMAGVQPGISAKQFGERMANTALGYVAGPLPRFATTATTGKSLSVPSVDISEPGVPSENFRIMDNQFAMNVKEALKEANPIVNSLFMMNEGKPLQEIASKQATRYMPKSVSGIKSSDKFGEIVNKSNTKDYADRISKEARKLPRNERMDFIAKRLESDNVDPKFIPEIQREIKFKGTFKYD